MRQMKDSGIEWIGQIPQEWEVKRIKKCIDSVQGGAWGEDAKGDLNDIVCLRIADFDYANLKFQEKNAYTIRNYGENTISHLLLKQGDLLIEKSGGGEKTPVGRVVRYDLSVKAVYANFMDRIRCRKNVDSSWMNYLFATFYGNGYTFNMVIHLIM